MIQLPFRPAAALLSKKTLAQNLKVVRTQIARQSQLHKRNADVMAIVKADAYGHDIDCIVPVLSKMGVKHFAVASLAEGIEARLLNPKASILVLGGTFNWTKPAIELLRKFKLKVAANDIPSLKSFLLFRDLPIHLKLDTGMNRLGLKPDDWAEAIRLIGGSKVALDGLFTHFATVSDAPFHRQAALFEEATRWFWSRGLKANFVHSENSSSLFGKNSVRKGLVSEISNLTRPGIALYGYLPYGIKNSFGLKPILELTSDIGIVKRVELGEAVSYGHYYKPKKAHDYAVVPLGYADGVSKVYGDELEPEWRSSRGARKGSLKVCGAICMDMVMLRAQRGKLQNGDRVIFWGRFPNALIKKHIVEPYELNLRIAKRIPRLWVDS